ncbi:helix-turn-helix domain-containing protein [Microbacterium oxydans]|uniref:helix-turn-helix domain-containing protein n=1 Tax=Microbacterium oxydans TaxID=82380 RepID=UPI00366A66FB
MTDVTPSHNREPSDAAWQRSGDIGARILESLAQRDALSLALRGTVADRSGHCWLSPSQVCDVWPGMTVTKLQRMRDEGRGPAYSKLGKTITYDLRDVDAFIAEKRIGTRDQA